MDQVAKETTLNASHSAVKAVPSEAVGLPSGASTATVPGSHPHTLPRPPPPGQWGGGGPQSLSRAPTEPGAAFPRPPGQLLCSRRQSPRGGPCPTSAGSPPQGTQTTLQLQLCPRRRARSPALTASDGSAKEHPAPGSGDEQSATPTLCLKGVNPRDPRKQAAALTPLTLLIHTHTCTHTTSPHSEGPTQWSLWGPPPALQEPLGWDGPFAEPPHGLGQGRTWSLRLREDSLNSTCHALWFLYSRPYTQWAALGPRE